MHDAIMYIKFLNKPAVTIFRKRQYIVVAKKETEA